MFLTAVELTKKPLYLQLERTLFGVVSLFNSSGLETVEILQTRLSELRFPSIECRMKKMLRQLSKFCTSTLTKHDL